MDLRTTLTAAARVRVRRWLALHAHDRMRAWALLTLFATKEIRVLVGGEAMIHVCTFVCGTDPNADMQ